jgi:hypothetical protein
MSKQVAQELNNSHSPEAYVSNFTFFDKPEEIRAISLFNAQELCVAVCQKPSESARYIHELWRIGHISTIFEFLTMDVGCIEDQPSYPFRNFLERGDVKDDIIFNVAFMLKIKGISQEECTAFLYDISVASFNAQNGFELEYEPAENEGINEKVTQMMQIATIADFDTPVQTTDAQVAV